LGVFVWVLWLCLWGVCVGGGVCVCVSVCVFILIWHS